MKRLFLFVIVVYLFVQCLYYFCDSDNYNHIYYIDISNIHKFWFIFLIKIGKKKKIFIEFFNFFGLKQKIKPLKDYHFIKISSLFEFGRTKNSVSAGTICFIYNYILQIVNWYFYHKKPYLSLNNKTIFYENENVLKISVYATLVFNFLMVTISILKIILEKILYAIRRKKRKV